ncbi:MAG TPA: hypothetical protein VFR48_10395 [Solirubrobacteraceae bacterium]|nr:hypothetical protein [Solirubrobacteraceae bacterium]
MTRRLVIRRSLIAAAVVALLASASSFGAIATGLGSWPGASAGGRAQILTGSLSAGKVHTKAGKPAKRRHRVCKRSKLHHRSVKKRCRKIKKKPRAPTGHIVPRPPAAGAGSPSPLTSALAPVSPAGGASPSGPSSPEEPSPPPAKPTNVIPPSILGPTVQGETLSATTGSWEGAPTAYTYQWQDCNSHGSGCTSIAGANSASYTLGAADIGQRAMVVVEAVNAGGASAANSSISKRVTPAAPAEPPDNVSPPTIVGVLIEGEVLEATPGNWTGESNSYAYQWQSCDASGENCTNILGASEADYRLGAGDVAHTIRVLVSATNSSGSASSSSAATATIAEPLLPPPAPPSNETPPSLSGTATEGQSLTASKGTWSGAPTSYSYQWQDCDSSGAGCVDVATATNSTYRLSASDVGHTVRVMVSATNGAGTTPADSAVSSVVDQALANPDCTITIASNLQSAIQSAASGSTICLQAGNYGSITLGVVKSSMVTIMPAAGVNRSQVVLGSTNVTTSSNLTFEDLTIAGANTGSSSAPATHVHWIGDAFTSGLCIQTPTSANIDVLVEGSSFVDIGTGGCNNEGRLEVNGDNQSVSGINGVVISHDLFAGGSPSGCTDGVNITGGASGTQIGPGDEFSELKQGSCAAHVDSVQFYGASDTVVTGDYFHDNSDGIMSPDGNGSPMTVTNTVFDTDGEYPDQIVIGGGGHDVISHDTFGHGARVRIGHVNVGATASTETIANNVLTGGLELSEGQSSSGWSIEYNLVEGEVLGSHAIMGKPTYSGGGNEPSTWGGWMLTTASLGHMAASNGSDMGTNYFGS